MLKELYSVERNLQQILAQADVQTMYIDYHKPFVSRVWFQYGLFRIFLHKIEPCAESTQALFHPHPWKSAVRIIKGKYEMGVGHTSGVEAPRVDCKLILGPGACYEMTEANGWHYVAPKDEPVYSLMITGHRNNRPMPIDPDPDKKFRTLSPHEIDDIFQVFNEYYKIT